MSWPAVPRGAAQPKSIFMPLVITLLGLEWFVNANSLIFVVANLCAQNKKISLPGQTFTAITLRYEQEGKTSLRRCVGLLGGRDDGADDGHVWLGPRFAGGEDPRGQLNCVLCRTVENPRTRCVQRFLACVELEPHPGCSGSLGIIYIYLRKTIEDFCLWSWSTRFRRQRNRVRVQTAHDTVSHTRMKRVSLRVFIVAGSQWYEIRWELN